MQKMVSEHGVRLGMIAPAKRRDDGPVFSVKLGFALGRHIAGLQGAPLRLLTHFSERPGHGDDGLVMSGRRDSVVQRGIPLLKFSECRGGFGVSQALSHPIQISFGGACHSERSETGLEY